MGANCCTPTKHKNQFHGTSSQFSTHRNATYSPSWSLHWDNKTHIEDAVSDSRAVVGHPGGETKVRMDSESEGLSDSSGTPKWRKIPRYGEAENRNIKVDDLSISGSSISEDKHPKTVEPLKEEPSTSKGLKSLINPRQSSVASINNNDHSSDGWSMRMFSEILASSQRGRSSFDSESISSSQSKIICHSLSSADPDTCVICTKPLRERSPWSTRKIVFNNLGSSSIIAVLACGHTFHAECLERETAVADKFDPPCTLCIGGEKLEARERNKLAMSAIDLYSDAHFLKERQNSSTSGFKSFGRPFLKRHFSVGSRSSEASMLDAEKTNKRKGLWARNRDAS